MADLVNDDDVVSLAEDAETEREEAAELEADQRKIWVQIDPYYYLTGNRYNPVILVRFTHPNRVRRDNGEIYNNSRWYFSNYRDAIQEYAHQYAFDHGHELKHHDLESLQGMAKLVDDAFENGMAAVKKFDQQYQQPASQKAFGQKGWPDQDES